MAIGKAGIGAGGSPLARWLPITLGGAAMAGALLAAPAAGAAPDCVQTGPTTTQCETPGHTQIITSPPAMNDNSWYPYGGFVVGFPW